MSPPGGTAGVAGTAGADRATGARTFDLRPLLAPRSIAIVGASPRSDLATTIRDNIPRVGSETRCFFVNPKYDEIAGTPSYADLAALPEVPDLAVVALNPLRAPAIVREAAAAGIRAVMIPGGGVVEGGEAAARMQAEVAAIAIETGTAILGPNCMGVIDLTVPSATYIDDLPALRRGGTAAIAQSGSAADAFVHAGTRIGWSRIISCGSEVVLDVCDYLGACLDDPETHAIVLFVEGFKRPDRFLALADRALAMDKPVLALKVGRSELADAATLAHTGSLAGDARATDAALRAVGVIQCRDLDELLEAAALVDRSRRLGRRVGRGRTAVVTVSTGEGALIADTAPRVGLDLPPLPADTEARIRTALPTLGYVGNPLDPWGAGEGAPTYRACFRAFAESGAYDVLALVHDFPYRSQPGEVALALELGSELIAAAGPKPGILPVFVSLTSGDVTPEVEERMDAAGGVPILRGTGPALAAIAGLARWERDRDRRVARGPVRPEWRDLAADVPSHGLERRLPNPPEQPGLKALSERDALRLIAWAGLPTVETVEIAAGPHGTMLANAVVAVGMLGWPVAVKVDAVEVAHKSDVGGVVLGVRDRVGLDTAMTAVLRASPHPRGVLIQPMVGPGVELIVGARRDEQFGPLVLVGIGGLLAEALDDVAVRLAPVDVDTALEMLGELRGAAVLDGVRGTAPIDRRPIAELVVALGRAMLEHPEWLAVDLNPVVARPDAGPVAVDALAIVGETHHPDWDYEDPGGRPGS